MTYPNYSHINAVSQAVPPPTSHLPPPPAHTQARTPGWPVTTENMQVSRTENPRGNQSKGGCPNRYGKGDTISNHSGKSGKGTNWPCNQIVKTEGKSPPVKPEAWPLYQPSAPVKSQPVDPKCVTCFAAGRLARHDAYKCTFAQKANPSLLGPK